MDHIWSLDKPEAVSLLLCPRDKKKNMSPNLGSQIPVSSLISQDGNGRIQGCSHILMGTVTGGWSHLALLERLSSQNDPKAF